jgi:hypothetical protein
MDSLSRTTSGARLVKPAIPRPPPADTAAASCGDASVPMPALKIGYVSPNVSISARARGVGMADARCCAARVGVPLAVSAAATAAA